MPVRDASPHDLQQRLRAQQTQEATEAALARLFAIIEASEVTGPAARSYAAALIRHGETLRRIGGTATLRLVFDRLCTAKPERASRRSDLLAEAWGDLLSKGGRP